MATIETNLHLAQAGLSAYSLFHAYISISNLRQWEATSEKAAQYSETAAHELHKTRTTQTSGALAVREVLCDHFGPRLKGILTDSLLARLRSGFCRQAR